MLAIDFNRPQEQILIDLIRINNEDKSLELEWVDVSIPVTLTPDPDMPRNTEVTLTMLPSSPLRGSRSFFYNRLDIEDFLFDGLVRPEHLRVVVTNEVSIAQLAPKLSEILHIRITPDMVVDKPLPLTPIEGEQGTWFELKPTNYAIIGSLYIWLTR